MTDAAHPPAPAQSTPAEFAEAIGRAVLAWQDVELRCAHLYVWLLDARNAQGAISSISTVHSMTMKSMMMKVAAKHLFHSPEFEDLAAEFDELMSTMADCSRFRNRLSHSEVAEELTETGWAYKLQTPAIDAAAALLKGGGKRVKAPPLDYPAIRAAEGQFRAIAEGLLGFEEQLRERMESF
jgi:hypothetical protein